MTSSAAEIQSRLLERFAPGGHLEPLAADASVRDFFRVHLPEGDTRVFLVDAAGGPKALDRMVAAHDALDAAEVRCAQILDRDDALCALLMEDLGDTLLADALPSLPAGEAERLYEESGAMAGRLASRATEPVVDGHPLARPQLALERLRIELAFFAVHDIASRRGHYDIPLLDRFSELLDRVAAQSAADERVLAHRDFHARNLLVLPTGELACVDYQDALLAPRHYDLASLVRDPYVEPAQELEDAARRGFERDSGWSIDEERFAWVALQRDLKAIGTYAFQSVRRGKRMFADWIAPAERLALRALEPLPADVRDEARDLFARVSFHST